MADQDKINLLHQKLDFLIKRQDSFQKEISDLRKEIQALESNAGPVALAAEAVSSAEEKPAPQKPPVQKATVVFSKPASSRIEPRILKPSNWEKFIGENLISKIGVMILIIGVGIGAKYAIDNELISPLTRIILGYAAGLGLLGFALKLKAKFESFSAVLLSGSMAIMYFITFLAYSLYGLVPQPLAFVIMVLFTAFTVFASLKYNQQVIAVIGLAGAYSVPFLLSDGSGRVLVLFCYMSIINIGILAIAFKKYWRLLNIISFAATWLIFGSWIFTSFSPELHLQIALLFLLIFFIIFYASFLSYKLAKNENYEAKDIFSVLSNSFIFYGLGIVILKSHPAASSYFGLFTLLNAVIHFAVSSIIHKKKLADKSLFYLVMGLVLTFITLAIPVQLNGRWVTLIWVFQGMLLFFLGRSKKVPLYEKLSYIIMLLAAASLFEDWLHYENETPVFNPQFLNSLLFAAAFGLIAYFQRRYPATETARKSVAVSFMNHLVQALFVFVLYNAIRMEISNYWNLKIYKDKTYFPDFYCYRDIWVLNFTLLYLAALLFVIVGKVKSRFFEISALVLSVIAILIFLTDGQYKQSELIYSYCNPDAKAVFPTGIFAVAIRYISLLFLGILAFQIYRYFINRLKKNSALFETGFSILLVWVLSAEMLIWIRAHNSWTNSKLGLSILWGILSLLLISYGIWKNRKHLRILAIALFGITLVKLFLYDIAALNTIRKTIVFVSLGILLLIISFLYNKYKHLLLDDDKK
ncbi:MAG TPA: DUF2339 domain-containing protein [Flavobacterium sp.]|nr:DUF2339 domain-containing protein [Flavobacterium sp.]